MSNDNAAGSGDNAPNNPTGAVRNPPPDAFGGVRNALGFLLAGFGAILTFLGVRSSEVTTVLRNDSLQASLIALILLFGVLTAVWAVTADNERKLSQPRVTVVAMGAVLVGIAALVVFLIPIEAAMITISGTISLVIGCVLVLAGIATAGIATLVRRKSSDKQSTASQREAGHKRGGGNGGPESTSKLSVRLVDVLILTSVVLIAIAAYGAMRLETRSQLSFSSQVGAVFSLDGSLATVSVNIDATKIAQNHWVFVDVYALPMETSLNSACALLYQDFTITSGSAPCATDPCLYFSQSKYQSVAQCAVLSNGSIVPNATGDVDETLTVPFLAANYQDVDVRAEVCSVAGGCEGSTIGQNSRLDWIIPNSPNKPG